MAFLGAGADFMRICSGEKRGNVGRFFALGGEGGGRARKQQWSRPLLTITITIGPLLTIGSLLHSLLLDLPSVAAPTLAPRCRPEK